MLAGKNPDEAPPGCEGFERPTMAQAAGQCHEFGGGGPQGHFIDARMAYVSTHSQEFQTARAILPLRRPPRPAS